MIVVEYNKKTSGPPRASLRVTKNVINEKPLDQFGLDRWARSWVVSYNEKWHWFFFTPLARKCQIICQANRSVKQVIVPSRSSRAIIYVLNFIIPVGIMWFEFGTSKKTVWKRSPRSCINNGGRWQQQLIAYSGANFTFEGCRTTSNFKNRIYFLAVGVKSRVRSSGVKLPCLGLTWIPRYTKDS